MPGKFPGRINVKMPGSTSGKIVLTAFSRLPVKPGLFFLFGIINFISRGIAKIYNTIFSVSLSLFRKYTPFA